MFASNSPEVCKQIAAQTVTCNTTSIIFAYFDWLETLVTLTYKSSNKIIKWQLCFIKKNGHCRHKYVVLGRDRYYFMKKTPIWFFQKVLWDWNHQHARVFDWQHIYYLWWACFSADIRHTYGHKLCSTCRRLVPLLTWGRFHTGASQEKQKEAIPIH
jgi:hypothetical protein